MVAAQAEYINIDAQPTIAPKETPNVRPARKIVMEINSKFGINIKIKPNPMAVDVNMEDFTRLVRFIFLV